MSHKQNTLSANAVSLLNKKVSRAILVAERADDEREIGHVSEIKVRAAWMQVAKLERHPTDNDAREKLAMIYAEHFQRPDLAIDQLEQLVSAPKQSGKEVARWLNVMADLQLKHGADYDTIRGTLQRVIDLFPELAAAQMARQRIELLRLELKGKEKSQVVKLGSYEKDIGLKNPPRA